MPNLTATFKLVDEMSSKMDNVAASGQSMASQLEQSGEALSAVFDGVSGTVTTTATTIDGVATSIDSYGTATGQAASQTDYWTEAVGNYDRSALDAIFTTEELVEKGLKSSEALQEQEAMFALCEKSSVQLNTAMEEVVSTQTGLSSAIENSSRAMSEISDSEKVSAEAKQELAQASEAAVEAMKELETTQTAAQQAAENYEAVINSGTTDLDELGSAAEQAGRAYDNLVEANQKAANATDELSKASEKVSEESEKAGKSGSEAVAAISSALAAAGITAAVKEISEAVYELVEAFSQAESTVVMATGATGEALDSLMVSTMDAYSAAKNADLSSTAGAIGEINTRMGLTGDELTDVTGKFLDFASVTGGNATSSVRNVTQLMNQWGIEADNLESVLDRLTYAGQVSGISVDALSSQLTNNKAVLEQLGFSFDEAIAMFSNFELAGTTTTAVMTGFRSALSSGAISSLDELYYVFEEISSGAISAADASEIFGTRAGPAIVSAVNSGTLSLDSMVSALENTDGTLDTTAEAAQTLDQKWTQATNNVSTAFTSAVEPTLSKFSSGLSGVANSFGDFLNEHPKFTKAISAIGIGIGVVVAGIAGVTLVTTVAIPAITAFGTAFNAALGPIGWVTLAITGVVAAGTALIDMFSDAEDETAGLTSTSRDQYYQLQGLNAEYEEACDTWGEADSRTLRLKYEVDDLSEAFEANKQTVEEMNAEYEEFSQKCEETISSYQDSIKEIHDQEIGTYALIQKLEDLASQNEKVAGSEELMKSMIEQLNDELPNLSLSYEDVINNVDGYAEVMKKAAKQQAEEDKRQEQIQAYINLMAEQEEAAAKVAEMESNLAKEREAHDMYYNEEAGKWMNEWYGENSLASWLMTDLGDYEDKLQGYKAWLSDVQNQIAEIEDDWEAVGKAAEKAAEEPVTSAEAVSIAYEGVKEEIEALCTAYDEAYEAAYESFQGQFGLFDEAEVNAESTVENAQKALDSQLEYWSGYLDNVKTLKSVSAEDLGITQDNYDALMAYVQDGSQESAGLVQSMVKNINSGNEEAVAKLANTVGEIEEKQSKAADKVVNWSDDFKSQLDDIEEKMQATIEDMNLDTEAADAASSTISAYIDKIRAGKGNAAAAAQEVANAVKSALFIGPVLDTSGATASSVSIGTALSLPARPTHGIKSASSAPSAPIGYASGTLDATPGIALVGEEGPELINFAGGEVVYTADETARILSGTGTDNQQYRTSVPASMHESSTEQTGNLTTQEKKIVLEIAGQGSIDISNGVDKETVIDILYSYLKPVLAEILQQESYEEGDLSYDY